MHSIPGGNGETSVRERKVSTLHWDEVEIDPSAWVSPRPEVEDGIDQGFGEQGMQQLPPCPKRVQAKFVHSKVRGDDHHHTE